MAEEKVPETHFKLHNGVLMPKNTAGCAYGNWSDPSKPMLMRSEEAWSAIKISLDNGVRAFDIARMYGTERHLGDNLREHFQNGAKRSDFWITTKFAHPNSPVGFPTNSFNWRDIGLDGLRQKVHDHFWDSLDKMGVTTVDMILVHWPSDFGETDAAFASKAREIIWKAFEELYKAGRTRAIGVSNWAEKHLQEIIDNCDVVPMLNQIQYSPYAQYPEIQSFCESKGIAVAAHSMFGSGTTGVLEDPVIQDIAERVGKTTAQVILRWNVQQGRGVVPKSSNPARIAQNLDITGWSLSKEDIAALDGLNGKGPSATGPLTPTGFA